MHGDRNSRRPLGVWGSANHKLPQTMTVGPNADAPPPLQRCNSLGVGIRFQEGLDDQRQLRLDDVQVAGHGCNTVRKHVSQGHLTIPLASTLSNHCHKTDEKMTPQPALSTMFGATRASQGISQ